MKKTFISASVASVLALASFGALAEGPSFYGRLELALTNTETGATLQSGTNGVNTTNYADENNAGTYLENNFSLLGVKGSEKIADGYDVVYQMEFQVENTSGSGDVFKARNTFLGLKTNAGTILVGRNDTVFKQAEGAVDVFGNTNADIDRLVGAQGGEGRSADGVWYYSPKIADLITLNATYLIADNDEGTKNGSKVEGSRYAASATLGDSKFKDQNYYFAVAYNKGIALVDSYRVVGQVKLGDFKVGGLFQNTEDAIDNSIDGNSYFVNVVYTLSNGVNLKAEYGADDGGFGSYYTNVTKPLPASAVVSDINVQNINVGADYRLSKSTMVYGQYSMYSGDHVVAGNKVDLQDDNVFSVGVRYDF